LTPKYVLIFAEKEEGCPGVHHSTFTEEDEEQSVN